MIYPESNAYRSETGGVMSALRDLTVEQSASAFVDAPQLRLLTRCPSLHWQSASTTRASTCRTI